MYKNRYEILLNNINLKKKLKKNIYIQFDYKIIWIKDLFKLNKFFKDLSL